MFLRLVKTLVIVFLINIGLVESGVVKGTVVATAQGEKYVEDLRIGNEITGFNVTIGQEKKVRVTDVTKHSSNQVVMLTTVRGEIILAVPEQQFFDPVAKQWIFASDFTVENHFLDRAGNKVACHEVIYCSNDAEICDVYDITTDDPHTFFVTDSQFLTHNVIPVAIGISFAFDSLLALKTWAFAKAVFSFGAIAIGTAGIAINQAQAVRDLEKCFKYRIDERQSRDHILQKKHNWQDLVPDPNNNWEKVVEIITLAMTAGTHGPYKGSKEVMQAVVQVRGRIVEVIYIVLDGIRTVGNGWVK